MVAVPKTDRDAQPRQAYEGRCVFFRVRWPVEDSFTNRQRPVSVASNKDEIRFDHLSVICYTVACRILYTRVGAHDLSRV